MNFTFTNNSDNIITLPKEQLLSKISTASESEIKILLYAASFVSNGNSFNETDIVNAFGLDLTEVIIALQFWRGAGVLKVEGQADSPVIKTNNEQPASAQNTDRPKVLQKNELPSYSGEEIHGLFGINPELEMLIDECNKIAGKLLNAYETNKIVAFYDYLKLSSEYIISVYDYCKTKRDKTTIHYLEKTIFNLIDEGVDTDEKLRAYFKKKEEYYNLEGKIKRLFGIERSLSSKEKKLVEKWAVPPIFSNELLELAYDQTVAHTINPTIPYMDKILTDWKNAGIYTLDQAKEDLENFKKKKEAETASKESSFDDDEFFKAALKKSYDNIGKKPNN